MSEIILSTQVDLNQEITLEINGSQESISIKNYLKQLENEINVVGLAFGKSGGYEEDGNYIPKKLRVLKIQFDYTEYNYVGTEIPELASQFIINFFDGPGSTTTLDINYENLFTWVYSRSKLQQKIFSQKRHPSHCILS